MPFDLSMHALGIIKGRVMRRDFESGFIAILWNVWSIALISFLALEHLVSKKGGNLWLIGHFHEGLVLEEL